MDRKVAVVLSMALMGAVLVTSGCCKKKKKKPFSVLTSATATSTAVVPSSQSDKLDQVVKCYNEAFTINKMARWYDRRLRGRSPSRYRVPMILFKPGQHVATQCNKAGAMSSPPIPEIDGIMKDYVPIVATVVKEANVMDQYYRSKEYKSDNFAKGKELDKSFREHYAKFKKLHEQLSAGIDKLADKRDEARIKRLAALNDLHYHTAVFLRDARLFMRSNETQSFDQARFASQAATLEASYKKFADYTLGHSDEASKVIWFSVFKRYADSFIGAVRSSSKTRTTRRQRDKINDKYNDMVRASNRLRWR